MRRDNHALALLVLLACAVPLDAMGQPSARAVSLPGVLTAGGEYCSDLGNCNFAGSQQECTWKPAPKSDACWKTGVPPGSSCVSQHLCRSTGDAPGEIPLTIVSMPSGPSGRIKVLIHGEGFNVTSDEHLIVIYHGVRMTLDNYNFCFPGPGNTYTVIDGRRPVCPQ